MDSVEFIVITPLYFVALVSVWPPNRCTGPTSGQKPFRQYLYCDGDSSSCTRTTANRSGPDLKRAHHRDSG